MTITLFFKTLRLLKRKKKKNIFLSFYFEGFLKTMFSDPNFYRVGTSNTDLELVSLFKFLLI